MNIEIGNDIISIERIRQVLEKRGLKFLQKYLLPSEILLAFKNLDSIYGDFLNKNHKNLSLLEFKNKLDSINSKFFTKKDIDLNYKLSNDFFVFLQEIFNINDFRIESLAGFWAIKEAVAKGLGVGIGTNLSFKDIRIYKDSKGKPHISLLKSKKKIWNLKEIKVSLSHDSNLAFAVCLVIFKS